MSGRPIFVIRDSKLITSEESADTMLRNFITDGSNGGFSVALNAEKIIRMYSDNRFRSIVQEAENLVYDGVGCKFWLRWWDTGFGIEEQKVDMPQVALNAANELGALVAVFAGRQENLCELRQTLTTYYPGINFVLVEHGFHSMNEMEILLDQNEVQLCFLGLGSPLQEQVAAKLAVKEKRTKILCVGGAFDVQLGMKTRAPKVVINSNFEWLYRLLQDPRRVARYLKIIRILHVIPNFVVKRVH